MFNIKNILLPTDFSNISLSAASYAADIAKQYDAKIHLLYVLEKTPPVLAIRSLDLSEDKIIKSLEEEAKKSLENTAEKVKKNFNSENLVMETVLRKGLDYIEINKYSEEKNIDLIVIATHGRTGLLHTLLGSVAENVIRFAKRPVLVISPSGKEK
ncbi:MAG: universal stress protein [Ignavibacteriaceae bacterium]